MTYARVIPRDLFNEGSLLTCLGMLAIQLGQESGHNAVLTHLRPGRAFVIEQDSSDGSIYATTVWLRVGRQQVHLFRPLNARNKWPLMARFGPVEGDHEDLSVFDSEGNLSPEFKRMIGR